MELQQITIEELYSEFPQSVTPYGSEAFNRLNAAKADSLAAYILRDSKGKARLGVLAGERDGSMRLPFRLRSARCCTAGPRHWKRVWTWRMHSKTLSPQACS